MILSLRGLEKIEMGRSISKSLRRSERKSLMTRKAVAQDKGKIEERNMSKDVTSAL